MKEGQVQRSILNDVGTNKDAADEMELLFGSKKAFPYPKPESLIARLLVLKPVLDFVIRSLQRYPSNIFSRFHRFLCIALNMPLIVM